MATRTIAQVIDYGGATGGSFIPALAHLANAVSAAGDRFVVIARAQPGATWPAEMRARGIDLRIVDNKWNVASELRALRPDVIHSHFTTFDITAATATRSRVLWHVHSVREDVSLKAELRARIKYQIVGMNVSEWLCVSEGVRQEVLDRGAPARRVRVVANGTDTERFRPATAAMREEARRMLGVPADARVLLFFDRTPIKGGSVLREAMRSVQNVTLLLNGGNDDDWAEFRREHNVVRVPRVADTRPLYWAADALAFPSFGEGSGFVLSEAASCGLPVAASDIPPVVEMLGGCADAHIFPRANASSLAAAIEAALSYNGLSEGRDRILERFSLERWTRDLVQTYTR